MKLSIERVTYDSKTNERMYVPASELCLLCVNTIDYNKWKPANEVTLFVDWLRLDSNH